MLRSCKGNVRLAWPFIEALSDVPLANRHVVSGRSISNAARPLNPVAIVARPSSGLGAGTRWSDCRSRRNKTANHSGSQGSTSGLAPRPIRQDERGYTSAALAIRDESDVADADSPARLSHHSPHHIFPLSTSSRKPAPRRSNIYDQRQPIATPNKRRGQFVPEDPTTNELRHILKKWTLGTKYRDVQTVSPWIVNLLNAVLKHRSHIKKDEKLRIKVINQVNRFAQAVIDRNIQEARANNGLPSKVPAQGKSSESTMDWRTSKPTVGLIADVMIKFGLISAMEEMINVYGAAHKANPIDLSGSLAALVSRQRWPEVLRYIERAKRRNPRDPGLTVLQMKALNELRRHDEVIRLHSVDGTMPTDVERSGREPRQEQRGVPFLCEVMRAHLALKRVLPAMQIRESIWSLGWQQDYQAGYAAALAAGIRSAGYLPEVEEKILADEMDVLQGEGRRDVLDALACVRVAVRIRIGDLLPFYGLGKEDWRQTLEYFMESPMTVEWMLGSWEISGRLESMSSLWDKYIEERKKRREDVPSSILAAYVKACVRLRDPHLALTRLEEVSRTSPEVHPGYEIDVTVLSPLLTAFTQSEGPAGAEKILDFAGRAGIRLDRKAARRMVAALLEHYDISTSQQRAYLLTMVETVCGAGTSKRAAFTSALNSQDRAVVLDRRSLREIARDDIAEAVDEGKAQEQATGESTALQQYHRYLRANDRIAMMRPRDFYEAMLQYGVSIDSNRFTEIIRIYLESKDIHSAVEAFDVARLVGVKPGFHMWVTLLWGAIRYGGFKFCQRLLFDLRANGLRPNAAAWATVGAALIRGGQYRQSREFCDLGLKKLELATIDTVFVSVCFNARCRAGKPQDAIDMVKRFEASGHIVIDKTLRESIKRFHDWHKKQDRPDAAMLAANFAVLIGDGAAQSQRASEVQAEFIKVKKWLRPTLRKYWLNLPDVPPSDDRMAKEDQQKLEFNPDDAQTEKNGQTGDGLEGMTAQDART